VVWSPRPATGPNRPESAREHYAIELTDPPLQQTPFLLAQVLHTSGKLERLLGNRHDAIARLTQARDIFARLEATSFLERCRADLATCGLAVQEPNPDGLTPRERDVAPLVKHGYTTKEVASELFLTAKTVEFHLRNIYAKLGVPGRQQLRRMREP
jgi:DNA-binding CsgD family transcriptional regulator